MFTNKIKELREQKPTLGISITQLAEDIGVSISYISMLEKGKIKPSMTIAFKLAKYFKCRVDDIFEDIKKLDINVYAVNDPAERAIKWYENENSKEGWMPFEKQKTWKKVLLDGNCIYTRAWSRYFKGQAIIAIEGDYVEQYTGYNTIIITTNAPLTTYKRYIT